MQTLLNSLEHRAHHNPGAPAIISHGMTNRLITNNQLCSDIQTASEKLLKSDTRCLGIYLDNCAEWIIADLAASKLGITVVPIPLFFTAEQIIHLITQAKIDHVIVSTAMSQQVLQKMLPTARLKFEFIYDCVLVDLKCESQVYSKEHQHEHPQEHLQEQPQEYSQEHLQEQPQEHSTKPAKITFTSGSTGTPKGVCLSQQNIESVCISLRNAMSSISGLQRHLCVLPLATLLENIAGVYVCLMSNGIVITEPLQSLGFTSNVEFNAEILLSRFAEHGINSAILFPQILENLVNCSEETIQQGVKSLRFIAVGGGKVSVHILNVAKRLQLPIFEGYGLSECGSVVCLNLPDNYLLGSNNVPGGNNVPASNNAPGSVGKPLEHATVSISAEGEIIIHGQVMLGYLGEQYQSTDSIHTGDLGYIDEQGFVHVTGRIKNTLITSFGRNVSPEWVESELRSQPEILQAAVFGDATAMLSAVIVVNSSSEPHIGLAIKRCNENLPDYAQIRQWVVSEQVFSPQDQTLTHNGRIKRSHIEARFKDKFINYQQTA